jgi:hypothetical protein
MATIRPPAPEVLTATPTPAPAPTVAERAHADGAGGPTHVELVTFESVYRDEYDPMVRVAYLLVRNLESAEEIVQDAFVRLHLRWDRVATPGGFLRTCVVNGCRDRLRRRGRLAQRLPLLAGDVTGDLADGTAPAGELHDVLARLPLGQRTALSSRWWCSRWKSVSAASSMPACTWSLS